MRPVSPRGRNMWNSTLVNRYSPKRVLRVSGIFAGAFVYEISDFSPHVRLHSSDIRVYGCSLRLSRNTYTHVTTLYRELRKYSYLPLPKSQLLLLHLFPPTSSRREHITRVTLRRASAHNSAPISSKRVPGWSRRRNLITRCYQSAKLSIPTER